MNLSRNLFGSDIRDTYSGKEYDMSMNTAGWVGGSAVEQPELKQQLEQAPVLKTELLGEPARGANSWEHWAVPNPDGKPRVVRRGRRAPIAGRAVQGVTLPVEGG